MKKKRMTTQKLQKSNAKKFKNKQERFLLVFMLQQSYMLIRAIQGQGHCLFLSLRITCSEDCMLIYMYSTPHILFLSLFNAKETYS